MVVAAHLATSVIPAPYQSTG